MRRTVVLRNIGGGAVVGAFTGCVKLEGNKWRSTGEVKTAIIPLSNRIDDETLFAPVTSPGIAVIEQQFLGEDESVSCIGHSVGCIRISQILATVGYANAADPTRSIEIASI